MKVLVTRRWPRKVEGVLAERFGATLSTVDVQLTPDELHKAAHQYDVILPTITDRFDSKVLSQDGMRLRFLGNFGAGTDHIDLDLCRTRGIAVTNTPDVLTEATADVALLLMLAVARRASEGERLLRDRRWGGWRPTDMLGLDLTGRTLGLVGYGRIAQAFARKARSAFGMAVAYHARNRRPAHVEAETGAVYHARLETLLRTADVVSLHCPGGLATERLIDASRLRQMKSHAILINTARGTLIDESDLADALAAGALAGAGLDVYRHEPTVHPALVQRDDVILLPHLGSATNDTRIAMGMRVVANLDQWLAGATPHDLVV